jgi:hypothetical protein
MIDNGGQIENRKSKIASAWDAWCRFWFTPADPTPLCLMRIVTGLLVLYVHVAYTFDLQALFGPDGWYPTAMADRERREWPVFVPQSTWGARPKPALRMPDNGDQRHALRLFAANLANDPARQDKVFQMLDDLAKTADVENWLVTFRFLRDMPRDVVPREEKLRNLVSAPRDDDPDTNRREAFERLYGRYLLKMNPQQREKFVGQAHAFAEVLPAEPDDRNPDDHTPNYRRNLFELLMSEGPASVRVLEPFVREMTEKYKTPPEREAYLEYTEYWSSPPDDQDMLYHGHDWYSPFFHVTNPTAIAIVHGVHIAIILLFTFGVFTRVTSVLTWVSILAYVQRNPLSLFGQDTMMNLCVFYLMFAPCGAMWSVDAWLARRRAAKAGLPPSAAGPRPMISANVVLRLIQVQYCMMYLSAGLSKLKGGNWWTGTAPWYCLTNPEFSPLHIPFFRDGLYLICQDRFRWLWEIMMTSLDIFTLVLEIGLPFLVWTRLRPIMVLGAILLHLGIALNMGLVVFSLFMFTLLLAWMPAGAIRRLFEDRRSTADGGDSAHRRTPESMTGGKRGRPAAAGAAH